MFALSPAFMLTAGAGGPMTGVNPLAKESSGRGTLSSSNLVFTSDATQTTPEEGALSSVAFNAGIRYFEITLLTASSVTNAGVGVGLAEIGAATYATGDTIIHRKHWINLGTYNDYYNDNSKDGPGFGPNWNTAGTVIGVLVNFTAHTLTYYVDGTIVGVAPTTLTTAAYHSVFIVMSAVNAVSVLFNGGDQTFAHQPTVAGLVPWNDGL